MFKHPARITYALLSAELFATVIISGCGEFASRSTSDIHTVRTTVASASTSSPTTPKVITISAPISNHASPVHLIANAQKSLKEPTKTDPSIYGMRKFPYPYQAMLAISSDADSETLRKFNLVHEFINTKDMTPAGPGLGLDFSDSFFFYNGNREPGAVDIDGRPMSDELSYNKGVSNQPYAASIISHYIQVGWIDTMHTYGDFSEKDPTKTLFTRQLAAQAISELESAGDYLTVWTDHGNKSNVDNFGSFGTVPFYDYEQGANPTSPYFHTDLTIPYGIKFVWPDSTSDQLGLPSMIYPLHLPDGRTVWGFSRYTNSAYTLDGNPEWNWTVYLLHDQITIDQLHKIEKDHDYSIIAQHLSGTLYPFPLSADAQKALRLLAQEYYNGHILVARTSRLLQYNVVQQYIKYRVTQGTGETVIHILNIDDPVFGAYVPTVNQIRGVTFYTSNPWHTVIEIGNAPIPENLVQVNPTDGRHQSIGIAWFPPDTTDYSETAPGIY